MLFRTPSVQPLETVPTRLKAWGKLPRNAPLVGSTSSASSPFPAPGSRCTGSTVAVRNGRLS